MKITILASDELSAPLYRVRLLAKMLQARFDVEVLGFVSDPERVDPAAPRDFPYTAFSMGRGRDYPIAEKTLRGAISGDLIYAMKPRPTSFGTALRHRRDTGIPVVVDIDDAELSMVYPWSKYALKNFLYALPRLAEPNNYAATWLMDTMIGRADGRTAVSRTFLERYGGLLAPQYVDTSAYDPSRFDRAALRQKWGLEPYKVIVFAGIAHPSKGVDDIVAALASLGPRAKDWRLVIVGPRTPFACCLASRDERVLLFGTQPPEKTPEFLALADLVVLPQKKAKAAVGQMPMKLYEAMAMGLPIIATAMSDIPELLDGCGLVAPPGDVAALADAMLHLLSRPERAAALGRMARERVVERYSWGVGAAELGSYLLQVAAQGARRHAHQFG